MPDIVSNTGPLIALASITTLKSLVDQLRKTNFHADPDLYEQILKQASEAD